MKTKTDKKQWKNWLEELEQKLEDFFIQKLPQLPDKAREILVKIAPYFAILAVIMTVPAIIGIMGVGFAASLLWNRLGFLVFSLLFTVLTGVLEAMAIKGLFDRQIRAWKLLFYISLIQALSSILRFDLFGFVIGSGLNWYILFQIKKYYK